MIKLFFLVLFSQFRPPSLSNCEPLCLSFSFLPLPFLLFPINPYFNSYSFLSFFFVIFFPFHYFFLFLSKFPKASGFIAFPFLLFSFLPVPSTFLPFLPYFPTFLSLPYCFFLPIRSISFPPDPHVPFLFLLPSCLFPLFPSPYLFVTFRSCTPSISSI